MCLCMHSYDDISKDVYSYSKSYYLRRVATARQSIIISFINFINRLISKNDLYIRVLSREM